MLCWDLACAAMAHCFFLPTASGARSAPRSTHGRVSTTYVSSTTFFCSQQCECSEETKQCDGGGACARAVLSTDRRVFVCIRGGERDTVDRQTHPFLGGCIAGFGGGRRAVAPLWCSCTCIEGVGEGLREMETRHNGCVATTREVKQQTTRRSIATQKKQRDVHGHIPTRKRRHLERDRRPRTLWGKNEERERDDDGHVKREE